MRLTFYTVVALAGMVATGEVAGATLAGHEIRPGEALEIRFPVSKYYQDYAAQGGNPRPATGRAVLVFPKNFDPAQRWPLLIVSSTTDGHWTNPHDVPFYQWAATHEGWIVLATDATITARVDSNPWRLSMIAAALDYLHKEWPQSAAWPVAFAGISGGAKRSGFMAAMLATTGSLRICGFFLCGINDDQISVAYREFRPPPSFLDVPIWLSSGSQDRIAPPLAHQRVEVSLANTGFKHVALVSFQGDHEVKPAEVQRALRWFRELGRF